MISHKEPIRFYTETGSVYEYDPTSEPKRVRRVCGSDSPTLRMGQDEEWRPCASVEVSVDFSAVIDWTGHFSASVPGATPCTLTSRVFYIEPLSDIRGEGVAP